jgi:hypothetical protein
MSSYHSCILKANKIKKKKKKYMTISYMIISFKNKINGNYIYTNINNNIN